jgi:hypothetical protein
MVCSDMPDCVNRIVCEGVRPRLAAERKSGLTLAKAVPLISAAALMTACSAGLLMDRSFATTGARGFRLELLRASMMVSYSDLGSEAGDKYFRIDLGEDLLEEGLRMST